MKVIFALLLANMVFNCTPSLADDLYKAPGEIEYRKKEWWGFQKLPGEISQMVEDLKKEKDSDAEQILEYVFTLRKVSLFGEANRSNLTAEEIRNVPQQATSEMRLIHMLLRYRHAYQQCETNLKSAQSAALVPHKTTQH